MSSEEGCERVSAFWTTPNDAEERTDQCRSAQLVCVNGAGDSVEADDDRLQARPGALELASGDAAFAVEQMRLPALKVEDCLRPALLAGLLDGTNGAMDPLKRRGLARDAAEGRVCPCVVLGYCLRA